MSIERDPFGATPDGTPVERYRLVNAHGLAAEILTYGGTLSRVRAPDRAGMLGDVVLGFDALEPYMAATNPYLGALIGRYGNRIAGGRFTLDGQAYALACNNGANHLHGGPEGFHRRVWAANAGTTSAGPALELRYRSQDGEEGYPGSLDVTVVYTLDDTGGLSIEYTATADQATVVNLTNHAYFNLAGGSDILGHELELAASTFLPIDAGLIPTGELRPVAGTPLDFTRATPIGARIGDDDEQLRLAGGYDHTWVLDKPRGRVEPVALVREPASGRLLQVSTSESGVQFYAGNQLDGSLVGRGGHRYTRHAGLCLEAQHFPDSPNQPAFPSTVLRPGQVYRQTTIYRFDVA